MTKRAASDLDDVMKLTPLGAGQEVGRSSMLMEFKGKQVLFDAGVHPAYSGLSCLPVRCAAPCSVRRTARSRTLAVL